MALDAQKREELQELKTQTHTTKRAIAPGLEDILYEVFPVLDHGFIRVIDYMGNDASITQAARVSYGKGTKQINQDEGLIRYLLRHRHTTPFEMCEIKCHVKMPLFVGREWLRHRTASINEYSARYSILSNEFYIPEPDQLGIQSKTNRQGRGEVLTGAEAQRVLDILKKDAALVYEHYEEMLNENEQGEVLDPNRSGLARELARMNITWNCYTELYWKIDLHNFMHFLSLRADVAAQYEIRVYALMLQDILKAWVPLTHKAFMDYRKNAVYLSQQGADVARRMIQGEQVTQESSGLTTREWQEFLQGLQLDKKML
jgi:thymidylate synthase (FAD)